MASVASFGLNSLITASMASCASTASLASTALSRPSRPRLALTALSRPQRSYHGLYGLIMALLGLNRLITASSASAATFGLNGLITASMTSFDLYSFISTSTALSRPYGLTTTLTVSFNLIDSTRLKDYLVTLSSIIGGSLTLPRYKANPVSTSLKKFGNNIMGKFQHPCDSFLPTMKLSTNLRKNQKVHLTSWKSPSDRSIGSFSTGIDPLNIPEGFVWKDGHPYWRTGPWNGQFFIGIPNWNPEYQNGFTVVDDKQGNVYATFAYMDVLRLSKFVLNSQGNLVQHIGMKGRRIGLLWGAPKDECMLWHMWCMKLKIIEKWNRGNWTSGCVRRTPLQCERLNKSGEEGEANGFSKLKMIKVPDFAQWSYGTKDDCQKQCLENCSCVAYAYDTGIGWIWFNNISVFTVIWVANREKPLKNSSGVLTISEDGNLVVLDGQKEDSLVIECYKLCCQFKCTSFQIWGTLSCKILSTKHSTRLSFGKTVTHIGGRVHGMVRSLLEYQAAGILTTIMQFTVVDDKQGTVYGTFAYMDVLRLSKYVLDSQGNMVQTYWNDGKEDWEVLGLGSPICSCLRGFEPKIIEEWNRGNWSSGCFRRTPLQCERWNKSGEEGKADGFFKLKMIKVPDFAQWSYGTKDDCEKQCLKNCSCVAYAYDSGIGCMSWTGNIIDLRKFSVGGSEIYIRLANLEFATKSKSKESLLFDHLNDVKLHELPIFNLEELAIATNDFHMDNKLGQGGFGPVYKGILHNGQEIAVKRLSRASGQGLEEFMNEVVVISKLQHRNLVRLHGCCIEGEEKMLIYEYMPNKSLDLIIFDFGMARIFGGNEDQAKTKRVVGTYGYMSPEYAMRGLFSEKSDVFSFGVLLLEIVSGRRNTSFCDDELYLTLAGFAWKLWNDDNIMALLDPTIWDPCFQMEMLRCIHVGLLCVQELARDRPTMSTIISMLNSEILDLPTPKQPAFTERQNPSNIEPGQQEQIRFSMYNVTVTTVLGR
uniref:Non-specific serine/threonine protein kinase n=1 Tax=Fagus sylvatica TaxID=28930 RepID=A0A2N9HRU4_FAGSY